MWPGSKDRERKEPEKNKPFKDISSMTCFLHVGPPLKFPPPPSNPLSYETINGLIHQ
jgi:hypothetical protein